MITLAKAQIYAKYRGDVDSWLRHGTRDEKALLTEGDWGLMQSIVNDLSLQKNNRQPRTDDGSKERTYTPITDAQNKQAKEETERFIGIVSADDYEDVVNELYRYA